MVIAADRLGPVQSNIPLRPEWRLRPGAVPAGHAMIDFGDDELTAGRAHPMIDQSLRLDRLAAEAADPRTAVILLDVVLGHGAHPDPASELAPAIAAARAAATAARAAATASRVAATASQASTAPDAGRPEIVVSLIGTKADPQDLDRQARALQAAGAHVFASNAQAARFACDLISGRA
jgi:FdrA protein